jgi:hypothetical protein
VDPDGNKIGQLEAVYVDTANDVPAFASVKTGMIGRHQLTFVPLDRATVAPSHVRVAYSKRQIKDAFEIDTDGVLDLLLIIVAIALGIIGAVVKGLLCLLIIGVVVLLADFIFLGAPPARARTPPGRVRQ